MTTQPLTNQELEKLAPSLFRAYKKWSPHCINTIQEHLIRGNLNGINKITGRRFTSKEIKSISTDI